MKKNEPKIFDYFSEQNKHRIVSDFVVSYFAHKIEIDMKDELKNIRDLSKEEVADKDVWTYAKEVAGIFGYKYFDLLKSTNGRFFVVPRDERFNDLEQMCERYAGVIEIPDSEKLLLEKKLYRIIMGLTKEERITGEFTLTTPSGYGAPKVSGNSRTLGEAIRSTR